MLAEFNHRGPEVMFFMQLSIVGRQIRGNMVGLPEKVVLSLMFAADMFDN
jgi:hypothetical protein